MTILVPTDFSKPSIVAILYAVRIAKKLNADIILLAVINMSPSSTATAKWKKLRNEMVKVVKEDADQLIEEIRKKTKDKLKISFQHIMGYPVEDMIESFAIKNDVDLIVMGTKGATGLKKVILGSNAASVIDNSSRPVIVVPGETAFKDVKKIIYATDMTNIYEEIKTLALFAGIFNAAIRVLHVLPSDSAKKINSKKTATDLIKLTKYPKISFHIARNDYIDKEVNTFVTDQKADLLAMFTHKLDFYEKLFGRSITRQLTFHTRIPLLTFNKTTIL